MGLGGGRLSSSTGASRGLSSGGPCAARLPGWRGIPGSPGAGVLRTRFHAESLGGRRPAVLGAVAIPRLEEAVNRSFRRPGSGASDADHVRREAPGVLAKRRSRRVFTGRRSQKARRAGAPAGRRGRRRRQGPAAAGRESGGPLSPGAKRPRDTERSEVSGTDTSPNLLQSASFRRSVGAGAARPAPGVRPDGARATARPAPAPPVAGRAECRTQHRRVRTRVFEVSTRRVARGPLDPVPRYTLTRKEAAASLGVSLNHFERRIQPELKVIPCGQLLLIPVSELERWVRRHARQLAELPTR